MQGELNVEAAADTARLTIAILGINAVGLEFGNPNITTGRTLPWLQDVAGQDVWTTWHVDELRPDSPGVEWRDVIVLDEENRAIAVYNLTTQDLGRPTNYETLKQILRNAATH